MPRDIQPPEAIAMLRYGTNFHSYFSYHLMNKRSVTLQKMFIDAWEIDENIQACEKLPKEFLDETNVDEQESEHVQKRLALNPDAFHYEQRIDNIIHFLEGLNDDVFSKSNNNLVKKQVVAPNFDFPIYDEYDDYDDAFH